MDTKSGPMAATQINIFENATTWLIYCFLKTLRAHFFIRPEYTTISFSIVTRLFSAPIQGFAGLPLFPFKFSIRLWKYALQNYLSFLGEPLTNLLIEMKVDWIKKKFSIVWQIQRIERTKKKKTKERKPQTKQYRQTRIQQTHRRKQSQEPSSYLQGILILESESQRPCVSRDQTALPLSVRYRGYGLRATTGGSVRFSHCPPRSC